MKNKTQTQEKDIKKLIVNTDDLKAIAEAKKKVTAGLTSFGGLKIHTLFWMSHANSMQVCQKISNSYARVLSTRDCKAMLTTESVQPLTTEEMQNNSTN